MVRGRGSFACLALPWRLGGRAAVPVCAPMALLGGGGAVCAGDSGLPSAALAIPPRRVPGERGPNQTPMAATGAGFAAPALPGVRAARGRGRLPLPLLRGAARDTAAGKRRTSLRNRPAKSAADACAATMPFRVASRFWQRQGESAAPKHLCRASGISPKQNYRRAAAVGAGSAEPKKAKDAVAVWFHSDRSYLNKGRS